MTNEEKKIFYDRCAEILKIPHEWNEPARRRTRWNNRRLGNGRFPGFGLVQTCGEKSFRVVSKAGTRVFDTADAVYAYLKEKT